MLLGFTTYSSSFAQRCSSVSFSQYDNFNIYCPPFHETRFVFFPSSHIPRVDATAAHTAPTSNIFTSSLQSGSIRSAGFSPLSFSASTLAPIDSRYLGEKQGARQTSFILLLQLRLVFLFGIDSLTWKYILLLNAPGCRMNCHTLKLNAYALFTSRPLNPPAPPTLPIA